MRACGWLLILAACAAPSVGEAPREPTLGPRGDIAAELESCERVIADVDPGSVEGATARFDAALRAARANLRAWGSADELERLVAFTLYSDFARRTAAGLRGSTHVERGLEWLELAELAVHARLGFEASSSAVLARRPELLQPVTARAAAKRAELPHELEPWVDVAAFRHLRGSDERAAYRMAALALDRGAAHADELVELEHWIEQGAQLEFHCPRCDHAAVARLRACPSDQTPNIDFVARPRER